MTCVPCVAVLEPGSAPESRTDSKRDAEEEPVRELQREERREIMSCSVEYASAAPPTTKGTLSYRPLHTNVNAG